MIEYLKKKDVSKKEKINGVKEAVETALERIKLNGEVVVRELSEKFDGWNPNSFRVSDTEIEKAIKLLPETFKQDTQYCQNQVRKFAEAQLQSLSEFEIEMQEGVILGQKLVPINNVGAYIPGGRFPIVSSVQMSTIPPKVAGVERVIACSPSQ